MKRDRWLQLLRRGRFPSPRRNFSYYIMGSKLVTVVGRVINGVGRSEQNSLRRLERAEEYGLVSIVWHSLSIDAVSKHKSFNMVDTTECL
jgi:hypothetical protein